MKTLATSTEGAVDRVNLRFWITGLGAAFSGLALIYGYTVKSPLMIGVGVILTTIFLSFFAGALLAVIRRHDHKADNAEAEFERQVWEAAGEIWNGPTTDQSRLIGKLAEMLIEARTSSYNTTVWDQLNRDILLRELEAAGISPQKIRALYRAVGQAAEQAGLWKM